MTLREQFESLKQNGYICDSDDLPPRRWGDGQLHEKKGGKWHVVPEHTSSAKQTDDLSESYDITKNILVKGKPETVNNPKVGDILIEPGTTGKHGYGINHMIEQRYTKDHRSEDEIAAMVVLAIEAAKSGEVTRDVKVEQNNQDIGTLDIEKNGIIAFVSKSKNGSGQKFVITGFDDNSRKEEATDAINAVIADKNYAHEFVIVKKHVGAVIASLQRIAHDTAEVKSLYDIFEMIKRDKYA
jgi:hypothetical protein